MTLAVFEAEVFRFLEIFSVTCGSLFINFVMKRTKANMSQINLPPPEAFEIPEHRKPASSDKPGKTYSIPQTDFGIIPSLHFLH